MCGICGILTIAGSAPPELRVVRAMAESIRHRGPDDAGEYADDTCVLAHRRLSIIDLSAAARQPLGTPDGRWQLVFNGEIYNYRELRRDLETRGVAFRTQSDAEVLLQQLVVHGESGIDALNGMFAFALWDAHERELLLVRDRLGIKPLYYLEHDGRLFFASEIKAFAAAGIRLRPDPRGIADYFSLQFCLGERTMFASVNKVLPGHLLRIRADGTRTRRCYWRPDYNPCMARSEGQFTDELAALLQDSIRLQLRADVPVGAHLSGGLDSSLVVCLAAPLAPPPLHAFTGAFRDVPGFDESPYARAVVEHAGACGHEFVPTAAEFIGDLPEIIRLMDEPAAGPGVFPQYCLARTARGHVKVVLGGQGGDEIFAGYIRYLVAYLEECLRGGIAGTLEEDKYIVTFASVLPNLPQLRGYEPLLQRFWQKGLFQPPHERYWHLIDRGEETRGVLTADFMASLDGYAPHAEYLELFTAGPHGSYINRMTWFDLQTLLPALLHVEDRTSMAFGLESRVPLLDHRIVELAAAMPPKVKFSGGRTKHILREVARRFVPPMVVERKDKMGFPVPLHVWYRQPTVRQFIHETISAASVRQSGIIEPSAIDAMLDRELAFDRSVWGLLCFCLWWQLWFCEEMNGQFEMMQREQGHSGERRKFTGSSGIPVHSRR